MASPFIYPLRVSRVDDELIQIVDAEDTPIAEKRGPLAASDSQAFDRLALCANYCASVCDKRLSATSLLEELFSAQRARGK